MMATSMKHRKTSASHHDTEDGSVHTLDGPSPSSLDRTIIVSEAIKTHHGRRNILSNVSHYFFGCNVTLALAAVALISTSISVVHVPSLTTESSDELERHPLLLPFSDLQTNTTPLTGTHSLGKDYLLQSNSAIAHDSDTHDIVAGTIHFPQVDLSSLLKEEAIESEYYRELPIQYSNQEHQIMTQPSYLSDGSDFDPVIGIGIKQHSKIKAVDYAVLTRRGYKMGEVPNQDRSFLANFFIDTHRVTGGHPHVALMMGIFDGHGPRGHEVSHYLAIEFPKIFARNMRRKQNTIPLPKYDSLRNSTPHEHHFANSIKSALNETFIEADANEPLKGTGGSTANVLFYPGVNSTVYIANVGDSTTLIVSYCKTKRESTIVYQNRKHKPHMPDERQRIENAGGIVRIPQSLLRGYGSINGSIQETSRVIIPDKDGNPFRSLALAMSRSIGDFEGKRIGLTAEPEIDVWDVNDWKRQLDTDQILDTVVS